MMARRRDAVDLACEAWGMVRRRIDTGRFGEASDWLGAVRCTIAEKRDLHAGATSNGRVVQRFPEVMEGEALIVARAFQCMPITLREVLYVHYVIPSRATVKMDRMGISPKHYWDRLGRAKSYVAGWLDQYRADVYTFEEEIYVI